MLKNVMRTAISPKPSGAGSAISVLDADAVTKTLHELETADAAMVVMGSEAADLDDPPSRITVELEPTAGAVQGPVELLGHPLRCGVRIDGGLEGGAGDGHQQPGRHPVSAGVAYHDRGPALGWPCVLAVGLTVVATIGYFVVTRRPAPERAD